MECLVQSENGKLRYGMLIECEKQTNGERDTALDRMTGLILRLFLANPWPQAGLQIRLLQEHVRG